MKFLRKKMEGDTPLNLGSKHFTQLSQTFLHYFVDFEVIDGHLNFCSRPPESGRFAERTQRKISRKFSSAVAQSIVQKRHHGATHSATRCGMRPKRWRREGEDMVTTKEQQVDLMQSLWWMKYHEMSSWSHLAICKVSKWIWYQQQESHGLLCFFLLYNGLSTNQQRGNIVFFIWFLHWCNAFGTLYRTR